MAINMINTVPPNTPRGTRLEQIIQPSFTALLRHEHQYPTSHSSCIDHSPHAIITRRSAWKTISMHFINHPSPPEQIPYMMLYKYQEHTARQRLSVKRARYHVKMRRNLKRSQLLAKRGKGVASEKPHALREVMGADEVARMSESEEERALRRFAEENSFVEGGEIWMACGDCRRAMGLFLGVNGPAQHRENRDFAFAGAEDYGVGREYVWGGDTGYEADSEDFGSVNGDESMMHENVVGDSDSGESTNQHIQSYEAGNGGGYTNEEDADFEEDTDTGFGDVQMGNADTTTEESLPEDWEQFLTFDLPSPTEDSQRYDEARESTKRSLTPEPNVTHKRQNHGPHLKAPENEVGEDAMVDTHTLGEVEEAKVNTDTPTRGIENSDPDVLTRVLRNSRTADLEAEDRPVEVKREDIESCTLIGDSDMDDSNSDSDTLIGDNEFAARVPTAIQYMSRASRRPWSVGTAWGVN